MKNKIPYKSFSKLDEHFCLNLLKNNKTPRSKIESFATPRSLIESFAQKYLSSSLINRKSRFENLLLKATSSSYSKISSFNEKFGIFNKNERSSVQVGTTFPHASGVASGLYCREDLPYGREARLLRQEKSFLEKNKLILNFQIKFSNNSTESISEANDIFPIFLNFSFDKGRLKAFVVWFLKTYGQYKTVLLLEKLKDIGFHYATRAGISLGIDDLRIPSQKTNLLNTAQEKTIQNKTQYKKGQITDVEYVQKFIDIWHQTSENLKKEVVRNFEVTDPLNPVYMMAFSGARGNISQVRQLVGMRGLMADPQGQIIDFPIRSNFREGLTLTEYIISTYGARKGIVDTALRTANAGYLTRRLVDVAQHIIVSEFDCFTKKGVFIFDMKEGVKTIYPLKNRLIGRVLARDVFSSENLETQNPIAYRNQEISLDLAEKLIQISKKILIRSPLTCETKKSICQLCYGWSLSTSRLVSIGEVVGVIAAQSIGEPGTQLTMRTFHTGGVFSGGMSDQLVAQNDAIVEYAGPIAGSCVRTPQGEIAFLTKAEGSLILKNLSPNSDESVKNSLRSFKKQKVQSIQVFKVSSFSLLFARNGQKVLKKQLIAQLNLGASRMNQRGTAEQTVYSEYDGELYNNQVDIVERFNEYHDLNAKSLGWGYTWILSGKIYKTPIESNKFPQTGDFITKQTPVNRIGWSSSEPCFLEIQNSKQLKKKTLFSLPPFLVPNRKRVKKKTVSYFLKPTGFSNFSPHFLRSGKNQKNLKLGSPFKQTSYIKKQEGSIIRTLFPGEATLLSQKRPLSSKKYINKFLHFKNNVKQKSLSSKFKNSENLHFISKKSLFLKQNKSFQLFKKSKESLKQNNQVLRTFSRKLDYFVLPRSNITKQIKWNFQKFYLYNNKKDKNKKKLKEVFNEIKENYLFSNETEKFPTMYKNHFIRNIQMNIPIYENDKSKFLSTSRSSIESFAQNQFSYPTQKFSRQSKMYGKSINYSSFFGKSNLLDRNQKIHSKFLIIDKKTKQKIQKLKNHKKRLLYMNYVFTFYNKKTIQSKIYNFQKKIENPLLSVESFAPRSKIESFAPRSKIEIFDPGEARLLHQKRPRSLVENGVPSKLMLLRQSFVPFGSIFNNNKKNRNSKTKIYRRNFQDQFLSSTKLFKSQVVKFFQLSRYKEIENFVFSSGVDFNWFNFYKNIQDYYSEKYRKNKKVKKFFLPKKSKKDLKYFHSLNLKKQLLSLQLNNICFQKNIYNFGLNMGSQKLPENFVSFYQISTNREKNYDYQTKSSTRLKSLNSSNKSLTQSNTHQNTYYWRPNSQLFLNWLPQDAQFYNSGMFLLSNPTITLNFLTHLIQLNQILLNLKSKKSKKTKSKTIKTKLIDLKKVKNTKIKKIHFLINQNFSDYSNKDFLTKKVKNFHKNPFHLSSKQNLIDEQKFPFWKQNSIFYSSNINRNDKKRNYFRKIVLFSLSNKDLKKLFNTNKDNKNLEIQNIKSIQEDQKNKLSRFLIQSFPGLYCRKDLPYGSEARLLHQNRHQSVFNSKEENSDQLNLMNLAKRHNQCFLYKKLKQKTQIHKSKLENIVPDEAPFSSSVSIRKSQFYKNVKLNKTKVSIKEQQTFYPFISKQLLKAEKNVLLNKMSSNQFLVSNSAFYSYEKTKKQNQEKRSSRSNVDETLNKKSTHLNSLNFFLLKKQNKRMILKKTGNIYQSTSQIEIKKHGLKNNENTLKFLQPLRKDRRKFSSLVVEQVFPNKKIENSDFSSFNLTKGSNSKKQKKSAVSKLPLLNQKILSFLNNQKAHGKFHLNSKPDVSCYEVFFIPRENYRVTQNSFSTSIFNSSSNLQKNNNSLKFIYSAVNSSLPLLSLVNRQGEQKNYSSKLNGIGRFSLDTKSISKNIPLTKDNFGKYSSVDTLTTKTKDEDIFNKFEKNLKVKIFNKFETKKQILLQSKMENYSIEDRELRSLTVSKSAFAKKSIFSHLILKQSNKDLKKMHFYSNERFNKANLNKSAKPKILETNILNLKVEQGWVYIPNESLITDFSCHESVCLPGKNKIDDILFDNERVYIKYIFLNSDSKQNNISQFSYSKKKNNKKTDSLESKFSPNLPNFCTKEIIENKKCRFFSFSPKKPLKFFANGSLIQQNQPKSKLSEISENIGNQDLKKLRTLSGTKSQLACIFLPMEHRILPNLHFYKRKIYQSHTNHTDSKISHQIKQNYHSYLLNKQIIDKKFVSTYPAPDLKLDSTFRIPTIQKKNEKKKSPMSGFWNFKKQKKSKLTDKSKEKKKSSRSKIENEDHLFLNSVNQEHFVENKNLKLYVDNKVNSAKQVKKKISIKDRELRSTKNEKTYLQKNKKKNLETSRSLIEKSFSKPKKLQLYFTHLPVNFLNLQIEVTFPQSFEYNFNRVELDFMGSLNPRFQNFINSSERRRLIYYPRLKIDEKNYFLNCLLNRSRDLPSTKTLKSYIDNFSHNRENLSIGYQKKMKFYKNDLRKDFLIEYNELNLKNSLNFLDKTLLNKGLNLYLIDQMAYFANQRFAAILFNHENLINNSKPNSIKLKQFISSFPIFKNQFILEELGSSFIPSNKKFAFTSFLSPYEGEFMPLTRNRWLKDLIENEYLVLSKSDLFSVSLNQQKSYRNKRYQKVGTTFPHASGGKVQNSKKQKKTKLLFPELRQKEYPMSPQNLLEKLKQIHNLFLSNENFANIKYDYAIFKAKETLVNYEEKLYKVKGVQIGSVKPYHPLRVGSFILHGDAISPGYAFSKGGQIIHIGSKRVTIRRAQPISLSPGSLFHFYNGDFVKKSDAVVTLAFQTIKTGDIVQGIPKVEQYFEARTSRAGRLFRDSLPILLQGLFQRYSSFLPLNEAVRQSILKIQQIIIDGVQRVYRSQGVGIVDKHLEIIVRQMTSKVQIINADKTGFFPGELFDFEFIEHVNSVLQTNIKYEPVVLGITRASLEVDSFLSAASFQQTTRVLSKAAISRKKDFLKGLKENLITANLIPAGTGYFIYSSQFRKEKISN